MAAVTASRQAMSLKAPATVPRISPSARIQTEIFRRPPHEPYKSLKRFKLVDEFADSEITLPLAKPSMPSAMSNRSKTEGAWELVGNQKMPGNGNLP